MSNFQYKAINASGQVVEGQVSASSTRVALLQLEKMGLKVESIQRQEIEHNAIDSNSSTEPSELLELRKRALQNARLWSAPMAALSEEIGSDRISRRKALAMLRTAMSSSRPQRLGPNSVCWSGHFKWNASNWLGEAGTAIRSKREWVLAT